MSTDTTKEEPEGDPSTEQAGPPADAVTAPESGLSPPVLAEDEKQAKPPAKPVPKSDVNISQTREETGSIASPASEGAELGAHTLARLIALRPFMTYFCWLAHKQNPAAHRPETRVSNLRTQNPKFYWLCVTGDFIVTIVAVVLLIAAAGAALYKTIWL